MSILSGGRAGARAGADRSERPTSRRGCTGATAIDITRLILDDHAEQRRLFSLIEEIDPTDGASLGAVWRRLATFLEVHAATEERIFYPALLASGRASGHDATDETLDAIKDHNEIRDAVAAVRTETVGTAAWFKAVAAANKANSDHMAEEEREGLTDFRRDAPLELRHALGVQFIAYETANNAGVAVVDTDPKAYVAANS